jgi:hypothetical protein
LISLQNNTWIVFAISFVYLSNILFPLQCVGQQLDLEDAAIFELSLKSGAKAVKATLFFPSSGSTPAETISLLEGETKAVEVNVAENGNYKMCFHNSARGGLSFCS